MKNEFVQEYVKRNLRACQLKQVDILMVVDAICKKHDIQYWLDGGTLLGAVRHKGFIPWDDDLDIGMTLEDLNKFCEISQKELPQGLFLQTRETDPSSKHYYTKIRDLNSFFVESCDDFSANYQKGIYIDIFGFVPYPNISRKVTHFITKRISKSYSILHRQHYYNLRSFMEFFYFTGMYAILRVVWWFLCITHKKNTYISNVLHNNGYGIMHRQDSIFPLSQISFEGNLFNAPANPDAYLTDLYGDYTTLPPPEKRKVHALLITPYLDKI